uniref:Uncharacterized protein n=1 Tax=Globisporangium ultimum (strain ATCC 200006 / CBS 805.95 / DAOM BR144) TaxID=431595 RepID=K3XB38_GLOUD
MLKFTHCPALVVRASIDSFRHLMGINIYNSTLVDWPLNAVISEVSHPFIKFITLVRVNMTQLPDGLLRPVPVGLIDI